MYEYRQLILTEADNAPCREIITQAHFCEKSKGSDRKVRVYLCGCRAKTQYTGKGQQYVFATVWTQGRTAKSDDILWVQVWGSGGQGDVEGEEEEEEGVTGIGVSTRTEQIEVGRPKRRAERAMSEDKKGENHKYFSSQGG